MRIYTHICTYNKRKRSRYNPQTLPNVIFVNDISGFIMLWKTLNLPFLKNNYQERSNQIKIDSVLSIKYYFVKFLLTKSQLTSAQKAFK